MADWYFAYGSNMNPLRVEARQLPVVEAWAAVLPGYRLVFNKRAHGKQGVAYANIAFCRQSRVEGVAYRLAEPADILRMDPFEGTPVRYSREVFHVETVQGPLAAWVYVANRAWIADDLLPERPYLQHLLAGEQYLSPEYRDTLVRQPCLDVPAPAGGLAFNV